MKKKGGDQKRGLRRKGMKGEKLRECGREGLN